MSDKTKVKVKVKDKNDGSKPQVKVKAKFPHPALKGLKAASVPPSNAIPMRQVTSDDPTKGLRDALKTKFVQGLANEIAGSSVVGS